MKSVLLIIGLMVLSFSSFADDGPSSKHENDKLEKSTVVESEEHEVIPNNKSDALKKNSKKSKASSHKGHEKDEKKAAPKAE